MQRSKSASTTRPSSLTTNKRSNIVLRRRSAGSLGNISTAATSPGIGGPAPVSGKTWRAPGCYEIPNVLGHAYLKPGIATSTYDLRPLEPEKHVSKRPWYPPSPYYEIPELPPLTRKTFSEFEQKLRKVLPKNRVKTGDPMARYGHFREIGTGVNGAVVSACYLRKPSVQVAIKRCALYPDREYRAAVIRELRIMASKHPNLIRLREVVVWHDDIWMCMDLMRCSVFSVLCQRGIPENLTVYITCQTLKALIYLHSTGYLHRDIKCENLLLGRDGQVKLADFGLSAAINRRNFERLGTNKWMAPELIRMETYDEKIDMWSLGITIIEMMDRVPPHYLIKDDEELFDVITTEPGPTFTYSHPSIYMRGLVAWLLDEDPRSRPSAKDVLLELGVHVNSKLLSCATAQDLARFLNQVLPPP